MRHILTSFLALHWAADFALLAFICVLSLILIGGAAQGISGLFMVVAVQLAALLATYVAMLAERRSAIATGVSTDSEVRAAAHALARGAAHGSLLSRISGRPDTNLGDR